VPGPELLSILSVASSFVPPSFSPVLAYGPAPGVELIPYFLGMVAWVGLAFATVLLWPFAALLRRFRRARRAPEPHPTPTSESSGQASHDPV
jgi:hypothetical protein